MAVTIIRDTLREQVWDANYFKEFIRRNKFAPYTGTGSGAIIQVSEDLTKKDGDSITFSMVGRLKGTAVRGANTLTNNEEALNTRGQRVFVELVRNGVAIDNKTEQIKTSIQLRNAARDALRAWDMETYRGDLIAAMHSIDDVAFGTASAAQRNTWMTNNADRVLFGASKSNAVSNVFATAAALVDGTNDKLTGAAVSLMKRIAKGADPRITPVTVNNDEEWYVAFVNSMTFRDFKNDPPVMQANRDAWTRGRDNPIFTDGDLLWDGVIVKEIEQIPSYPLGASGINIAPVFFCGAQAVGVAYAERSRTIDDTPRDYGRILPIGIEQIRGIAKLHFGTDPASDTGIQKDFGMVTGWFAAVPDA